MELTNEDVHETITAYRHKHTYKGVAVKMAEINQVNKILRQKGFTITTPKYWLYLSLVFLELLSIVRLKRSFWSDKQFNWLNSKK